MINIIVAIDWGGAIGRRGDLIYHISGDLRHFKELTTGHTVVMGRKTFESLPKGALPNRRNIVISRNSDYSAPGIEVASSLEEAFKMAAGEEIFIIGGAQIYSQALPFADRLYLTNVDVASPADADTYFPPIDTASWQIAEQSPEETDPKTGLRYSFVTLTRK